MASDVMLCVPASRHSALPWLISQAPPMVAAAATSVSALVDSSTRPLFWMVPALMRASPSSRVVPAATLIWPLDWLRKLPAPVRPKVPALICTVPVLLKPWLPRVVPKPLRT